MPDKIEKSSLIESATYKHFELGNRRRGDCFASDCGTVVAEYQAAAALKRELLYRLAVQSAHGTEMQVAHGFCPRRERWKMFFKKIT